MRTRFATFSGSAGQGTLKGLWRLSAVSPDGPVAVHNRSAGFVFRGDGRRYSGPSGEGPSPHHGEARHSSESAPSGGSGPKRVRPALRHSRQQGELAAAMARRRAWISQPRVPPHISGSPSSLGHHAHAPHRAIRSGSSDRAGRRNPAGGIAGASSRRVFGSDRGIRGSLFNCRLVDGIPRIFGRNVAPIRNGSRFGRFFSRDRSGSFGISRARGAPVRRSGADALG